MTISTKIHRFDDDGALFAGAADAVVSAAVESIRERGRFVVALSGGETPAGLYRLLAQPQYRRRVDWNRCEVFWGDERPVPPGDEQSNYRLARELLLEPVGVPGANIHRIEGERADLPAAARDYAVEIARCFGVSTTSAPPSFDLVLLGLGGDAHVASLFPGTAALDVTDRWVAANDVPRLSTVRVTLTFPVINAARAVFFLVAGGTKAAALAATLADSGDPVRFPGRRVRPADGRVEWFVDAAAAPDTR